MRAMRIVECTLAMKHGLGGLLGAQHVYPSFSEAAKQAAGQWAARAYAATLARLGGALSRLEARRVARALTPWMAAMSLALAAGGVAAQDRGFDHSHARWDELLKRHVAAEAGGHATRLDYGGMAQEHGRLKDYLSALSAVSEAQFGSWEPARQMAFLINAYNAFTVAKVLSRYPRLESIRDFGVVFGNPWRDRFFILLERRMHLDHLEHEVLRAKGVYEDLRVHYALNCASTGCPALREEAYIAGRLEQQLAAQARRFLGDRSRNRFNPASGVLEVSRILDWYREDWVSGYRGFGRTGMPVRSLEHYFARYAELLADDPQHRRQIIERRVQIAFLEYDWLLNDARRAGN